MSFVRRSGRMSDAQDRAWEELAPEVVIDVPRDAGVTSVLPGSQVDPAVVWGREAPLIAEIGSGQGHAIVHAAASAPDVDFLAIEVFRAGLARTMLDAERAGLTNLRLVEANAPEVLEHLLPTASCSMNCGSSSPIRGTRTSTTSGGSSPTSSRRSRRSALRRGGVLRLATDWEDYALQMRDVLDAIRSSSARSRGTGRPASMDASSPRSSARARKWAEPSATSRTVAPLIRRVS